jgi:uncharacterized membrane protein YcjF (UPF0283 family)
MRMQWRRAAAWAWLVFVCLAIVAYIVQGLWRGDDKAEMIALVVFIVGMAVVTVRAGSEALS